MVAVGMAVIILLSGCGGPVEKTPTVDGLKYTLPSYFTEDTSSSVEEASSTDDISETKAYNVPDEENGDVELTVSKTTTSAKKGDGGEYVIKFIFGIMGLASDEIKEKSETEICGYKAYVYRMTDKKNDIRMAYIANTDSGYFDSVYLHREKRNGKWPEKHEYAKDWDDILNSVTKSKAQ